MITDRLGLALGGHGRLRLRRSGCGKRGMATK